MTININIAKYSVHIWGIYYYMLPHRTDPFHLSKRDLKFTDQSNHDRILFPGSGPQVNLPCQANFAYKLSQSSNFPSPEDESNQPIDCSGDHYQNTTKQNDKMAVYRCYPPLSYK